MQTVEQRESISMAFLVLLERLTPHQRAVFLLHEVFAYSYTEIAPMIGASVANCRQLFYLRQSTSPSSGHALSRPWRTSAV